MTWPERIAASLKRNQISVVAYLPDGVTGQVVELLEDDPSIHMVPVSREDEAVAIAAGAYSAKGRAVAMMQSSGFGNCINALATYAIPHRLAFPFFVAVRGDLGDFNPAQIPMGLAVRPILDSLGLPHYTLTTEEQIEGVIDGAVGLSFNGHLPVAILLSSYLTGGKRAPR